MEGEDEVGDFLPFPDGIDWADVTIKCNDLYLSKTNVWTCPAYDPEKRKERYDNLIAKRDSKGSLTTRETNSVLLIESLNALMEEHDTSPERIAYTTAIGCKNTQQMIVMLMTYAIRHKIGPPILTL